jgi:hypothetical protein
MRPLLALRCPYCGATYFCQVLESPIAKETAEFIAEQVKKGDVPYIAEEVTLRVCACEKK